MDPPDRKQRFAEMYLAHYADVLGYIRRRTDSPHDAADAVAETFTIAWRRLADVPDGPLARPWLLGVARRVLANGRRAETRRSELVERLGTELAVWQARSPDPAEAADRAEVRAAFRRLRPGDREVLALASWEGLSHDEIAVVLGCSRATVRIRLHRARKRLAKELRAAGLDVSRYGARAVALSEGTT